MVGDGSAAVMGGLEGLAGFGLVVSRVLVVRGLAGWRFGWGFGRKSVARGSSDSSDCEVCEQWFDGSMTWKLDEVVVPVIVIRR